MCPCIRGQLASTTSQIEGLFGKLHHPPLSTLYVVRPQGRETTKISHLKLRFVFSGLCKPMERLAVWRRGKDGSDGSMA